MKLFALLFMSPFSLGCKNKDKDSTISDANSISSDTINEGDSLPQDGADSIMADTPLFRAIERLRQFVRNHDKKSLAQMFEYPIERSAPFSNIILLRAPNISSSAKTTK